MTIYGRQNSGLAYSGVNQIYPFASKTGGSDYVRMGLFVSMYGNNKHSNGHYTENLNFFYLKSNHLPVRDARFHRSEVEHETEIRLWRNDSILLSHGEVIAERIETAEFPRDRQQTVVFQVHRLCIFAVQWQPYWVIKLSTSIENRSHISRRIMLWKLRAFGGRIQSKVTFTVKITKSSGWYKISEQ